MKLNKAHRLFVVALTALLALAAVVPAFAGTKRQNIVEIAASNPDFSTLVAAVVKADLVDALDGPKRVTVFAPTNAAFDDLAGELGYANGMALVDALSAEQLTPILLYHVTNGNRSANTLFPPQSVRMLSGDRALTAIDNGMKTIDGQPIVATNIRASNGFIHVIGGVMLP
ncbi:Immunogenic protein MPT70 [Candidatus Promineifilum breve]|uniref:Immunogenic protein MPT70 n=1 Tax=Candidatus Promineifilum breve TaxID=1806508 RepID=A0A160T868_9CHLR|nr:fasciclin domain-containing protein [Candidatus Promineifilum breve]CUS06334.1 Immunogenic protein MPT70 [Candidatus Promineifilum breve]